MSGISGVGGKTISVWVDEITAWGKRKGWDKPLLARKKGTDRQTGPKGVNHDAVLAKLALVHSELSEALEEAREDRWTLWRKPVPAVSVHLPMGEMLMLKMSGGTSDKPEGFVVELADAVIRIFHIAGLLGLDLESAVRDKMAYNETRPHRHGGKKA